MQKYTIERFNDFIQKERPVDNDGNALIDTNGLMLEGAKEYYANVRYNQNDYVTKKQVSDDLENSFDEFYEQCTPITLITHFAKSEGIEEEAIIFAINQRKEEIVEYLNTKISEIAKAANEDE